MKIVITGGHHSSALPVIKELKNRIPDIQIYWLGHKHSLRDNKNTSLEYREITQLGLPFYNLLAGKAYRIKDPRILLKIPFGFFQAFYYLLKINPDIVLSFGGYLAVPVVLSAWFLRKPSITHEQTVTVGYANKAISYFVKRILVTWPQSVKYFPKTKTKVVGLPLRDEIFHVMSDDFKVDSGLPTIYVTAGKSGSHRINMIIMESLKILLAKYNVIHQCGDNSVYNDFDLLAKRYEEMKSEVKGSYHVVRFVALNQIGEAFARSNVVVTRSGAHIIYELLTLKKSAVLIPLANVSHNEQYWNAKIVEDAGLGKIILEKDLDLPVLDEAIEALLTNRPEVSKSLDNLRALESNAQKLVVDEILDVCLHEKKL